MSLEEKLGFDSKEDLLAMLGAIFTEAEEIAKEEENCD